MRTPAFAGLAMLLAGPALAQDGAQVQALRDCVYGQPAQTAISCVGEVEAACLADQEETDLTILMCREAEAMAWGQIMSEALPQARGAAQEGDGHGQTAVAPFDAQLEAAQAAWQDWTLAECDLQAARWGEASEGMLTYAGCMRRLVSQRVVELLVLSEGW